MQQSHLYRRSLSAVFLLLYLFITTPVQLWHHHSVIIKEKITTAKSSDETVSAQNEDCKICQHTYAAYFNDTVNHVAVADFSFPVYNQYQNLPLLSLTPDDASNKSPPVV